MIIAKYLIKNVFEKPLRTMLLILCMFCCCFVAALSLDTLGSLDAIMKSFIGQFTGTADITVGSIVGISEPYALSVDNLQLLVYEENGADIEFADGEYTYYHKKEYGITYFDDKTAVSMRLLPEPLGLAENEAAVTELMVKHNGYHVGDTITLYNDKGEPKEYKIVKVVPNMGIANGASSVYLSREGFAALTEKMLAKKIYVDVINDGELETAKQELEEIEYNGTVLGLLMDNEDSREMVKTLCGLFGLIFMVCFFLVIFVAFSVCNRIVCERMAVVGTFRSLGLSTAFTTRLLLLENALYGVLGGGLAIVIYALTRPAIFSSVFQFGVTQAESSVEVQFAPTPVYVYLLVLLVAVLVMVTCPLKEIIRTSKTAIRDIIFDNKDTAYRMRRFQKIAGFVCLALFAVTLFLKKSLPAQFICFCCLLLACAMLFPYVLTGVSNMLQAFFEKRNMPVARLAVLECRARKSTVGSAVLCVTVAVLAINIFSLVTCLNGIYDVDIYDCDVIATVREGEEAMYFSYVKDLEGAEETEVVYHRSVKVVLNGKSRDVTVFGMEDGGFSLLTAVKDCPEHIEQDSIVLDRVLARRFNLAVGDEVDVTFEADAYIPIVKKMKVQALVDAYDYDATGDILLISKDTFVDIYHDRPGSILISCANPAEMVRTLESFSGTKLESVITAEENDKYWEDKKTGLQGMLLVVILFGIGLTVVGMVSNQLIGFEGRRRECAVLLSTSMTKSGLSKMFLLESMCSAGVALFTAFLVALTSLLPLKRIMEALGMVVPVSLNYKLMILFLVGMWIIFTLVSLFPIRALKKMKIAAQLKYE